MRILRVTSKEFDALWAAALALEQCVSDFGDGLSVCLQAKQEAIQALEALKKAGIDLDE